MLARATSKLASACAHIRSVGGHTESIELDADLASPVPPVKLLPVKHLTDETLWQQ
jgi:hypothetical protein